MIKVLIVDDSALIRGLLKEVLEQAQDIQVVGAAEDPYQARDLIKRLNPDVLTLDIEMPKMDGLELIKRIKESGFFAEIPVMVLSCKNTSKDRIECLKAGATDYMVKPFNPEELLIRLENILQKSIA